MNNFLEDLVFVRSAYVAHLTTHFYHLLEIENCTLGSAPILRHLHLEVTHKLKLAHLQRCIFLDEKLLGHYIAHMLWHTRHHLL